MAAKKYQIIIEKSDDGSIWGRMHYGDDLLTSVAETVAALQDNFIRQLTELYEVNSKHLKFDIAYDLEAFFEKHTALNISAIGMLAGINPALMRHYKNGIKHPSEEQVKKIEDAVHQLGRELTAAKLVA